jgi:hypothetical protein
VKRPYRVRIKCDYVIDCDVDAESQADAETLVLQGRYKSEFYHKRECEVIDCERIEHDRFTED